MHTNTDKTKNLTMDNLISEPHSVLYDSILSPENIYSAIYALESYIYEDTLLQPRISICIADWQINMILAT